MGKDADLYTWDAQTHNMFAYAREAFQKSYDQLGIRADDYDEVLIMPARGSSGLFNGPGNYQKYKLRWIRDDQVDVVSQPGRTTHAITPIETPGGTKIVVIRTGLSTAYVAELRTKLGVDGLDNRARYQGVLLYRIDASQWEQFERNADLQVISKQYYNDPAVGGPLNKTGVWRPIDRSIGGLDTQGALWGPGDTFEDPATGVQIDFGPITHYLASDPANSPYTADDTATLTVTKDQRAELAEPVRLSHARLTSPTTLSFDTSTELQDRIPDSNAINNGHYVYIREKSRLSAADVTLTRGDGSVVPASAITGVTVNPDSVELTLAPGTFPTAASARGLTVATKPFFYFAASAPTPVVPQSGAGG